MFVKVCGTTSEEDALLAVAMGADAVGFIFAAGSKRQVSPAVVGDIVKRLPPETLTVGVFKDEAPQRVIEIVRATGLKAAQLHGHESPEQTQLIRQSLPIVFKVFSAGDPAVRQARQHGADAVLVDNKGGGTGQVFDWRLAEDVPAGVKLVLAGGLGPDNVGEAIRTVHPWGVDAASMLESSPGRKDARKVRAFVAAAREAAPEPEVDELAELGDRPYDWMEHGG